MNILAPNLTVSQNGHPPAFQVVIVGGGISGLSAAWYVQQEAARHNLPVQLTLLEASDRLGGKIQTEQVDGFGNSPFILEAGPDAFLTRKPWALELARELGLSDQIQTVNREHSRTFVLNKGKPVPLPDGLQLLVPTKAIPFLRSPLFSWRSKLRMLLERFIPQRASEADETLADFVCRRLGAEALDRLAEPLLAGVYNSDPESQSMLATFPQFPALEKRYGSLLQGMRASRREPDNTPAFISFQTGTYELIDALVNLLKADIRPNTPVHSILQINDHHYSIALADGTHFTPDVLILATSAKVSASLLKQIAPQTAAHLKEIRYASIGVAYIGFRRSDVPHPLNGFGVVIPSSEGRSIDGMTWVSSKWDQRAPVDHVLLRVFFGGPHTRLMMDLDDNWLLSVIREELHDILGIQATPLFQRVFRWPDGYPQYDLGHLDRIVSIESSLPISIKVTGSSYRGVGVSDCVKQGQSAAQSVVSYLASLHAPTYLSS